MSIVGSEQWMYASGEKVTQQSLKFNDDESQYLTRTPASAGNRKTWTLSFWVKFSTIQAQTLFATRTNTNPFGEIRFESDGGFFFYGYTGSAYQYRFDTTQLFRDVSAWYHFVFAMDTTQSTESNRTKIYVNGSQITAFDNEIYPTQNLDTNVNNAVEHDFGYDVNATVQAFDGYLSDINFIDGQALDPTSFGQFTDGYWEKIDYDGSYGTNGFHLTFQDDVVSEGFNAVTFTAKSSTAESVSGLGFAPDFVWTKARNTTQSHQLFDSVRGDNNILYTNLTNAESAQSAGYFTLENDGFNYGSSTFSANTYVGWAWDAGSGSPVSNTDGTITSTVKANPAYGFSISNFTIPSSGNFTVGHGLSQAPDMFIIKRRENTSGWGVWHTGLSGGTYYTLFDSTAAEVNDSTVFSASPDSSVLNIGSAWTSGSGGTDAIAYCFSSVAGYSSIGSYSGSGSAGKQVTGLGFKPAFLMIKSTTVSGSNWAIWDNTRSVVNPRDDALVANGSDAEFVNNSSFSVDFLSDGFELNSNYGDVNQSGATYIYMAFADTREAAFFKDVSGQGNHWTPNNLDYRDSLPDSPANNFATLNPLSSYSTIALSEGNLKASESANVGRTAFSSIALQSGKWYFEVYVQTAGNYVGIGLSDDSYTGSSYTGDSANSYGYLSHTGNKYNNGAAVSYGATFTAGDIVSAAFDVTTGTLTFYKNGASQGTAFTSISLEQFFTVTARNGVVIANFGQDSTFAGAKPMGAFTDDSKLGTFQYQPPVGFKSLCSANLPTPTIIDGSENFNTVLYTGDGNSTKSISGVGFSPDWVWVKNRVSTYDHALMDSVRGASAAYLSSNNTASESTYGNIYGDFTSFDSDGFSVAEGSDATYPDAAFNQSSEAYVAWNWKAGGTAVSNTDGSITSQVSANPTAGFSIIKYTGNGSNSTIGHGLSSPVEALIIKERNATSQWVVGHHNLDASAPFDKGLYLDDTRAIYDDATNFNDTAPTSTVFSVGTGGYVNDNNNTYICYAFHSVEGYSKVGSYVGNGSTDGTFVYTGFKPAWVMIKTSSLANQYWNIFDNVRDPFNDQNTQSLYPNVSDAEGTGNIDIDFLSNGMKMRDGGNNHNSSGHTYIYLAFAETPFKYANAR